MAQQAIPAPAGVVGPGDVVPLDGDSPGVELRGIRNTWRRAFKRDWRLYTLAVLPLLHLALFSYLPMFGAIIAFRRFRPGSSLIGDEWMGFHFFEMAFSTPQFWQVFWNTIILGGLWFVIGFPLPIILALMLNEVRARKFKRTVQTITYLPHFLSIVIVAGLVLQLTSRDGAVNQVMGWFGADPILFMQDEPPQVLCRSYAVGTCWLSPDPPSDRGAGCAWIAEMPF